MSKSLISKKIVRQCAYCVHGHPSEFSQDVFCIKHGIVQKNDSCRKFKYDILKRTPLHQSIRKEFTAEDFSI